MKSIKIPLVIGIGTNLGNRVDNLKIALQKISQKYEIIEVSNIFKSEAYDYVDQDFFYNQVLECAVVSYEPDFIMKELLLIEEVMGRVRDIEKGPRVIDIDLLFLGFEAYKSELVEIPHPRLFERSFVVKPLKELSIFKKLNEKYNFQENFEIDAEIVK